MTKWPVYPKYDTKFNNKCTNVVEIFEREKILLSFMVVDNHMQIFFNK